MQTLKLTLSLGEKVKCVSYRELCKWGARLKTAKLPGSSYSGGAEQMTTAATQAS